MRVRASLPPTEYSPRVDRRHRTVLKPAGLALITAVVACSTPSSTEGSGSGTTGGGGTTASSPGSTTGSASAPTPSAATASASSDGADSTGELVATVESITVTLAVPSTAEDVLDTADLQLCVSDETCFDLLRPARDDAGKREAGPLQFDVHAFDALSLDPAELDRYELRVAAPIDVSPHCLQVALNGEPAFCTRSFPATLGTGTTFDSDTTSDCASCFDRGRDTELVLSHGPFVGARDAQTGRATVWVRTDAARDVTIEVSASSDMTRAEVSAEIQTQSEDDFTGELELDGLAAGGVYYYRVLVDGGLHAPIEGDVWHASGVYRLEMPPPPNEEGTFTFAVGSCARMFAHGNYDAVRDSAPSFLLSVGDYHYGNVLQRHFFDEGASLDPRAARDEMRWWYRTAQWEKHTLLARVPLLGTWDDHDYGGGTDYADGEVEGREMSGKVFHEYFANPARPARPNDDATYFSARHGDAEFFVLDARWHRPRQCQTKDGPVACDAASDPLGAEQTDWLIAGLASSTATFKFIAAGTRFYGGGAKAWTPFLVARDAFLGRIADAGVTGVVFLSGGPHVSEYRRFDAAGRTWHEIVSSPLSSGLGECSGATGQIECYDAIKNFVLIDVDTTLADPTVEASIMTFDGAQPWSDSAPTIVLPLSALQ